MEGGCHCGNIRYALNTAPFDGDYCHCRDCQKITGSPISAWFDIKTEQLTWKGNPPKEYASSAKIRRGFCPDCGSTLTYRSTEHPSYLTLRITSLDDAAAMQPNYHIYTDSRVPWMVIDDALPRHGKGRSAG